MSELLNKTLLRLADAARTNNVADVAAQLKKLLEPLRLDKDLPSYKRIKYTALDLEVISLFWQKLCGPGPAEDKLESALHLYSFMLGASMEPTMRDLRTEAGIECKKIGLVCGVCEPRSRDAVVVRLPVKTSQLSVVPPSLR